MDKPRAASKDATKNSYNERKTIRRMAFVHEFHVDGRIKLIDVQSI